MATPISKSFNSTNAYNIKNAMLNGAIGVIDSVSAGSVPGNSSRYDSITWGSVASGSVSKSGTPVIEIPVTGPAVTIEYIMLGQYNAVEEWVDPYLDFKISPEEFNYTGSITIDTLTLSISNTIG